MLQYLDNSITFYHLELMYYDMNMPHDLALYSPSSCSFQNKLMILVFMFSTLSTLTFICIKIPMYNENISEIESQKVWISDESYSPESGWKARRFREQIVGDKWGTVHISLKQLLYWFQVGVCAGSLITRIATGQAALIHELMC